VTADRELLAGLEKAFDYRGDVTITKHDGTSIEGYIFDRRVGSGLADSFVRLIPKNGSGKVAIAWSEIAGVSFSGRDMAAGKSWETWVRNYMERKAAGEKNIGLHPEALD